MCYNCTIFEEYNMIQDQCTLIYISLDFPKTRNFLMSGMTVSFSKRSLVHEAISIFTRSYFTEVGNKLNIVAD
jgi:hypothetical protein